MSIICRLFGHKMHAGSVALLEEQGQVILECPRCGHSERRGINLAMLWEEKFFRDYVRGVRISPLANASGVKGG